MANKVSQELTAKYYSDIFGHHDGYIGKKNDIKKDRKAPKVNKIKRNNSKKNKKEIKWNS